MQQDDLAVVVDGRGRVLLVNLAQVDESDRVTSLPPCTSYDCEAPLFPTATASLTPMPAAGGSTATTPVPFNDDEVGFDDPRIVWKSDIDLVKGTLAPIVDTETGFVYTGEVLGKKMKVLSAVDPKVRFVAPNPNPNPAEPATRLELDRIVPLGIEDLRGKQRSAFQILVSLPGSAEESLTSTIAMAVETERVLGATTAQTPSYLPPAHLRRTTPLGAADPRPVTFELQHDAPSSPDPTMRFQRGWNRMVSKWIIAIADPRASSAYQWPSSPTAQTKKDQGCFSCERPTFVTGTLGTDWFELYTAGRFISVRPERCAASGGTCPADGTIFKESRYEYLGEAGRLSRRIPTIMADTVRPTQVLTAAQSAPVAVGAHQETFFVHSGEMMTGELDLDAGGRAGWNVVVDRTYRSRTLGYTALGAGWDSSMFRRLRALPNHHVEYRDGSGETWLFKGSAEKAEYESPDGFDLKLTRTGTGWRMIDAKQRITDFDELGRLTMDADEFYEPGKDTGNVITYGYDAEGRLSRMTDPVGRSTTLKYDAEDRLEQVKDWREREVVFHIDADRLLKEVELPLTKGVFASYVHDTSSTRSKRNYTYVASAGSSTEKLELGTNIERIREPADQPNEYRVTFAYETSGAKRDMIKSERWETPDAATSTFEFDLDTTLPVATEARVDDALKQKRTYTLTPGAPTDYALDRVHTKKMVERSVPIWQGAQFGVLPAVTTGVTTGNHTNEEIDRTWTFDYFPAEAAQAVRGRPMKTVLEGDGTKIETTYGWAGVKHAGAVLKTQSVNAPSGGLSQLWDYEGGFLTKTTSDGLEVETPEPHRGEKDPTAKDGDVKTVATYLGSGLVDNVQSSADGSLATGAGAQSRFHYHSATDPQLFRRGLPEWVEQGGVNPIRTDVKHPAAGEVIFDRVGRDYKTQKEYDEVGRLLSVRVTGTNVDTLDQFGYDASGRLRQHLTRQDSGKFVEQRYRYDRVGRVVERETYEGASSPTELINRTTYDYNLPMRATGAQFIGPMGVEATSTTTLDGLGRVQDVSTDPRNPYMVSAGGGPANLIERNRYDIHGNVVYQSNDLVATAMSYDGAHRMRESRDSGGNESKTVIDGFGRLTSATDVNTGFTTTTEYTPGGKVKVTTTNTSSTTFTWDGAGRTRTTLSDPGAGQPNPMSELAYDDAGRLLSQRFGEGVSDSMVRVYQGAEWDYAGGDQPKSVDATENDNADNYKQNLTLDAVGRATKVENPKAADMTIEQSFDSMGNSTRIKTPSKPAATEYAYDGRGLVTEEKQPDATSGAPTSVTKFEHAASGVLAEYLDAEEESTKTKNDGLGRPYRREYADGTWEEIHYELSRVLKVRDRQGRWQRFEYEGQSDRLSRVIDDTTGVVLDELRYDTANRLRLWKTPDGEIEFQYDAENRPGLTKQTRFDANGGTVDSYTQSHSYDGFGRRTSWTMPGSSLANGWTTNIAQRYDAAGNVVAIERGVAGGSGSGALLESDYRATGRPKHRTLNVGSGAGPVQIRREYDYDDEAGRLNVFRVLSNGTLLAGSEVTYEGTLLKSAKLLGLANGGRTTSWDYDKRGRLIASIAASADPNAALSMAPQTVLPKLDDVDFIEKIERSGGSAPAKTFGETASGHKIAHAGNPSDPFEYRMADGSEGGSVRTRDDRFLYDFDEKERLRRVTQRPTGGQSFLLRVVYGYSGLGRMISRRVLIANATGTSVPPDAAFRLATALELGPDAALPPDATFVWDPISDRMVAIFDAGSGQPLRQFIHGGMGLDDPVEVTVAEAGGPARYYPIYDEAGDGGLQAILSESGRIVARTILSDPYGDGEIALSGAAVEKVTVTRTPSDGVTVDVAFTEPIESSTLAAGLRLTSLTNATPPVIAAASSVTPALTDEGRVVRWSLSDAQWTALTAAPDAYLLSIAVTDALRASTYTAGAPVMPADTTQRSGVYTTTAVPFELRESFAELQTRLSGTTTPYVAYSLTALTGTASSASARGGITTNATPDSGASLLMIASFQAQSFTDPLTLKNYVRARWYDPGTGTFLTPDPMGYQDSSNLYAFAVGDPVNGRDPTGEQVATTADGSWYVTNPKNGKRYLLPANWIRENQLTAQDMIRFEGGLSLSDTKDWMYDHGFKFTHDYHRPVMDKALPEGDNFWMNALIATSGLPPQNRQQQIVQGGLQIMGSIAMVRATKAQAGTVSAEPYVPVAGGDVPVRIAKQIPINYPQSPIPEVRLPLQGSYIDPLTDTRVLTKEPLQADHIIPQSRIKAMAGFNRLTPEQQNAILNDPWNFAALPGPYNASKKDKMPSEWTTFKGRPLNPDYVARNKAMEKILVERIQGQIVRFSREVPR